MAIAEGRLRAAGKSHQARAQDHGDEQVPGRLAHIPEPRRPGHDAAQQRRVEQGHRDVAGECHEQLRHRHRDAALRREVSRERGEHVRPPAPLRREEQSTEQYDVGRPERREHLRERADGEGRLGTAIVRNADEERPEHRRKRAKRSRQDSLRQRPIGRHDEALLAQTFGLLPRILHTELQLTGVRVAYVLAEGNVLSASVP